MFGALFFFPLQLIILKSIDSIGRTDYVDLVARYISSVISAFYASYTDISIDDSSWFFF